MQELTEAERKAIKARVEEKLAVFSNPPSVWVGDDGSLGLTTDIISLTVIEAVSELGYELNGVLGNADQTVFASFKPKAVEKAS